MTDSTDDMTSCLTPANIQALEELLAKKFPKQRFSYEIHLATKKGENYVGVVYRVAVTSTKADNTSERFSIILKVPPQNLIRRKQFFARPCFLRESLAYEEFLPLVKEFQCGKGGDVTRCGFYEYPECYCSISDEFNEAIFLEDLLLRGFRLFDRFDTISADYVSFVMRTYGKLHAVSFAIKDQQPQKFEKFRQMKDIFQERKGDELLTTYFEGLKTSAMECFSGDKDKRYMERFEAYFAGKTFFELLLHYIDGLKCEPYAVVCHGDCWNNNILYRHENGKVIDACVLDWQVMRYATPISDLMYYMFACTSQEFRREHFSHMMDIYYAELYANIKGLGSDPEKLFSRSKFNEELKRCGSVGMLHSMIVLPVATLKSEDVPSLEEISEKVEAGNPTDLKDSGLLNNGNVHVYNKRLREIIIDCVDYGFI